MVQTSDTPVIVLDVDDELAAWLKLEAARLQISVEDLILEILETRRLFNP